MNTMPKSNAVYERINDINCNVCNDGNGKGRLHFNNEVSKTNNLSTIMIICCVLIGDMARGIMFPTLWLLVRSLGGNKFYQGCAVSAFSAGRIVSSPIFGYFSEKFGYRYVLMICNIVIFAGCFLYAISTSLSMLIGGQLIIGFGAGSLGVTRSYIAETTLKSERTIFMAYLTAVQYAGFTLTPVLGALVSTWGTHLSTSLLGYLPLNAYSLPAIVLGFFALLCSLLLFVLFVEINREQKTQTHELVSTSQSLLTQSQQSGHKDYDAISQRNPDGTDGLEMQSANSSYQSRIHDNEVGNGSQSNNHNRPDNTTDNNAVLDDTSASSSTSSESRQHICGGWSLFDVLSVAGCVFNMATKGTIGVFETMGLVYITAHYDWSSVWSGTIFTICGAVGVLVLLGFSLLLRIASDVNLVFGGMVVMTLSCLIFCLPIGNALPVWLFYVGIALMYSVGYPIGHTALIGIFSKLTKSGPQGRILGLFGSAGSLARIVFPLLAGILTELYSDKVIFAVMVGILVVCTAIYGYFKPMIQRYINLE